MPTNFSQLKELETVQVLDGKRISFSISDSIPCIGLFVTFRTELVLITIGTSSSLKLILFLYYAIGHHHGQAPKASKQYKVLETEFRSVKYTVITKICKNFEQLFIPIQVILGDYSVLI